MPFQGKIQKDNLGLKLCLKPAPQGARLMKTDTVTYPEHANTAGRAASGCWSKP